MLGHFNFKNLTTEIRSHMVLEIDKDIRDDVLYPSERFNEIGRSQYPALLREAAETQNEAWLADQLVKIGAFNETEISAGREKKVPRNAHTLLSQCEFNRFYIRALCCYALENPGHSIRVYRARESSNPRPESEAKIGRVLVAESLLRDLRGHIATDLEFGMPELNSGLSVELVSV